MHTITGTEGTVQRNSSLNAKRRFALTLMLTRMILESTGPCYLLTATFAENVMDHGEAVRRWKCFYQAMRRRWPGLCLVGVWARQTRGAWHVHAVFNRRIEWGEMHAVAQQSGWGSMVNVEQLGMGRWSVPFRGVHPSLAAAYIAERVARYVTGYLAGKNALDGVRDKGVRRVIVVGPVRSCRMRFDWSRGVGALFRKGLHRMRELRPHYNYWRDADTEGEGREMHFMHLVEMGWNALTAVGRQFLLEGGGGHKPCMSVRAWWFKGDDPVFPF